MTRQSQAPRSYNSDGRRAQAEINRERILAGARGLFVERGFAATSVADIAQAAGVSTPTVFARFGSKALLLKEAVETALVGDAEPVPLAQRPEMIHVREAATAEEVITRLAALIAAAGPRSVPVAMVMYRAADAHPEIAELVRTLDDQRLRGATALARVILDRIGSQDDARLAGLRDVIWVMNAPQTFDLYVHQRGWSPERYAEWFTRTVNAAMTEPHHAVRPRPGAGTASSY